MNRKWFGDSYDIVKRFFIEQLKELDYNIRVDPMLTGEWNGVLSEFMKFIGASTREIKSGDKTALFLDPDTGVGKKKTKRHITIEILVSHLADNDLVFSFDQSFSFSSKAKNLMVEKLTLIKNMGSFGFYYDSHARFLFTANTQDILNEIENKFLSTGLPRERFFWLKST